MKDTDTKNYSSAKIREFAGTDWGRGELNRYHHECIAKQLLNQYADEKDARAKLEEELRETKKILGRTQDHVKILKSRLDKAELSALELRKELYKFGPKALYDMTGVILDAIKGT